MARILVD